MDVINERKNLPQSKLVLRKLYNPPKLLQWGTIDKITVLVNGVLNSAREGSSRATLGATRKTRVLLSYVCPKRCATSG